MSYQYGDIAQVKQGDVVEAITTLSNLRTEGKLYICMPQTNAGRIYYTDNGKNISSSSRLHEFRLVKTKPGLEAKDGDTIISITEYMDPTERAIGQVFTNIGIDKYSEIKYKKGFATGPKNFLVLQQELSLKVGDVVQARSTNVEFATYNRTTWTKMHTEGDTTIISISTEYYELANGYLVGKDAVKLATRNLCNEIELPTEHAIPCSPEGQSVGDDIRYYEKQQKEATMPTTNENISITMTAKEHAKYTKSKKPRKGKTELEAKLPYAMVVYSNTGEYLDIHYNKTSKGVLKRKDKFLQKPWNLGCTVTIHKTISEFTTAIPVVKV